MSRTFSRGRKSIRRARRSAIWTGLEALEYRTLLSGSPYATSNFTPLDGKPTIVAGPGGVDGVPLLDLNGDGLGDLIVRYNTPQRQFVSALLSNPAGPMTEVTIFNRSASSAQIVQVITGDLNNDGRPEVFVQTAGNSFPVVRNIEVFVAQEGGTFTVGPAINLGSTGGAPKMSVFDMNGDGRMDLFLQDNGKITVHRGNGNGTFQNPTTTNLPVLQSFSTAFTDDLDGDGITDIVISGPDGSINPDNTIRTVMGVYKGLATGGYNTAAPLFTVANNMNFSALRQLSGDNKLDIIAYSTQTLTLGQPATVFVFRNNGSGGFTQTFQSELFSSGFHSVNSSGVPLIPIDSPDIDNDGDNDLILIEGSGLTPTAKFHILRNDGNAGFTQTQVISVENFASSSNVQIADIDDDGLLDLFVARLPPTTGWTGTAYFNNGNGTFDANNPLSITPQTGAIQPRLADLNNDGKLDVIIIGFANGYQAQAFINTTGRAFAPVINSSVAGVQQTFAPGPRDFNGDGILDLIGYISNASPANSASFQIFLGDGTGVFTAQPVVVNAAASFNNVFPVLGDINGDGKPDLIFEGATSVGSSTTGGVYVAINNQLPPADTAGGNANDARDLGVINAPFVLTEFVEPAVGADQRDRFDFFRFTIASAQRVRVTVTPEVGVTFASLLPNNGVGGIQNSFTSPNVLETNLQAGSYLIRVDPSNQATRYRMNIEFPADAPAIDVAYGLNQLVNSGPAIDFGSVFVTATDVAINTTFRVRNTGLAPLSLASIVFPSGFSLGDDALATTLAPGASDTFTVKLDTNAVGQFSGDIVISSTDPQVAAFRIPVTAEVKALPQPVQTPLIAVLDFQTVITSGQATPVNFGSGTVNGVPPTKSFTVRNDGQSALTLSNPQLPPGYTLVKGLPASLAPGASDNFVVSLTTGTQGTFSGNITIANNSGNTPSTFTFPVTGSIAAAPVFLPDLTGEIRQVSLGKNPVTPQDKLLPGDTLNTTLRIFNAGIGVLNAGNIDITFYASTDFTIDGGDIELQTFTAKNPRLAGGEHVDLNFSVRLPQNIPPGNYRLLAKLDSTGKIAESGDEANNTAPSGTLLPVVLEVGQVGSRSNVMLTLQEPDGTLVTFGLSGGGTAGISIDPETGAIDLIIQEVGEKSSLTINSKPATKGGDNTVLLRNVTIAAGASTQPVNASALSEGDASTEPRNAAQTSSTSPLGKLLAKTARLIGTLTAPGGLGALTLDAAEGAIIDIGAPPDPKATLTLSLNLLKDVTFTSQVPVKALSVVQWLDTDETPDSFTAPSLGSLATKGNKAFQIAGDFEADLNLTGVTGQAVTLGSAKIAGALANAAWTIAGNAGAITVAGNTNNSSITAGTIKALTLNGGVNTLAVNLTQPFNPANAKLVNLPKLAVKGLSDQLTLTSAGSVGAVTLGGLNNSTISVGLADEAPAFPADGSAFVSNPGTPGASLGKVTITGTYSVNNIAAASIASLTLPAPTTANGGTAFGVASRAIKAGKIGTLKLVDADKSGSIDPLTNGDFELRIV